jgi:hypothetical protein
MINTEPDAPLPNETTAALEAEKGWQTMTSKAMQQKTKAAEADNMRTETVCKKTPMKQNGEQVKKNHQPTMKNYYDMKT